MNIAPFVDKVNELNNQEAILIRIRNSLKDSIAQMKKDIIKSNILQEIGIQSHSDNQNLKSSVAIEENQLKEIVEDVRKV